MSRAAGPAIGATSKVRKSIVLSRWDATVVPVVRGVRAAVLDGPVVGSEAHEAQILDAVAFRRTRRKQHSLPDPAVDGKPRAVAAAVARRLLSTDAWTHHPSTGVVQADGASRRHDPGTPLETGDVALPDDPQSEDEPELVRRQATLVGMRDDRGVEDGGRLEGVLLGQVCAEQLAPLR